MKSKQSFDSYPAALKQRKSLGKKTDVGIRFLVVSILSKTTTEARVHFLAACQIRPTTEFSPLCTRDTFLF